MKKVVYLCGVVVLMLSLSACSGKTEINEYNRENGFVVTNDNSIENKESINTKDSLTVTEPIALNSNAGKNELTTEEAKKIINNCFKIGFLMKPNGTSGDALKVLESCGFKNIAYSNEGEYSNTGIKYEEFERKILEHVSKKMLAKQIDFKNMDGMLYIQDVGSSYCECKEINLVSASGDKHVYWASFICDLGAVVDCNAYVDIIKGENGKYVIDDIYNVTYITEYVIKDKLYHPTNNIIKDKLYHPTYNIIRDIVIDDFNNDGYSEAFVFISRKLSEEEIVKQLDYFGAIEYTGELWFFNSKGEVKEVTNITLQEHDETFMKVINIGNKKCIFVNEFTNGGNYTKIWSVNNDGNEISTIFDDRIYLKFNTDGTIYADYQSMDAYYDADTDWVNGRSVKEYYFYIDDGQIKEYGAIGISIDKLKEFDGAEEIINNITREGEVITDILYRENSIININTVEEYENGSKAFSNYTLEYDENKTVKDITSEKNNGEKSGIYQKAIKPECATYPTIS